MVSVGNITKTRGGCCINLNIRCFNLRGRKNKNPSSSLTSVRGLMVSTQHSFPCHSRNSGISRGHHQTPWNNCMRWDITNQLQMELYIASTNKWPYKWVTGVMTSWSGVMDPILIPTCNWIRGPPCRYYTYIYISKYILYSGHYHSLFFLQILIQNFFWYPQLWQVFRKDSTQRSNGTRNQYIPHFFSNDSPAAFSLEVYFFLSLFWSKDTTIIWRTKNRLENLCPQSTMWTSASNFVGGGTWIPQLRKLKKLVAAMVEQLIVASFFRVLNSC